MSSNLSASALAFASGLVVSAAALAADLPISTITLYRSGVGYFERAGAVEGNETVSLRFETEQINDILKSLVLLDRGGGTVSAIGYGSKEPLARRLASFGVDLSDDPSIATILSRLRGAKVRLTTAEVAVEGTILGVARRDTPATSPGGDGGRPVVVVEPFVNVVTGTGIRSVQVSRVSSFELADAVLAEELGMALAALAEQRNEQSANVELQFRGDGRRNVRLGYVAETPVWKTSYRLVLPDESVGQPTLQGWAIVENTTDEDWTDVRLALASGNPVGFRMDLHEPVFVERPTLPVPTIAAARARMYEGELAAPATIAVKGTGLGTRAQRSLGDAGSMRGMDMEEALVQLSADEMTRYSPRSVATAGETGEQFRYEIDAPVTIERQRSAMLPVVSAPVEGRRVSVYNPEDHAEHPMRGAAFRNTSGFDLAPGPVAVFDGGTYAGDAQIGFTSRAQDRILAYAVDLDVQAGRDEKRTQSLVRLRIVDGLVEQRFTTRHTTAYTFSNRDAKRERDLVIEQPRWSEWTVVGAKPASETNTHWRFETKLAPGAQGTYEVALERDELTRIGVVDYDLPTLLAYAQQGKASQSVVDAVREAAAKQAAVNELQRQILASEQDRYAIVQDQGRIRENMGRIERTSDLYATYMKKLTEQESTLEGLVQRLADLRTRQDDARRALNEYLRDLDVE